MSVSHAIAGADFVAPSDMMDGRASAPFRKGLKRVASAKQVSWLIVQNMLLVLWPFPRCTRQRPGFGDKKTYQMNFANRIEAIKETVMDVEEGADIVMVKTCVGLS